MAFTQEQKVKQLADFEQVVRELRAELALSSGEAAGPPPAPDVAAKVQQQEANAVLFDKLSPAELTHLYLTDRPRWEAIVKAKELAGWKQLFKAR
jgi:hypothetical protein